MANPTCRIVWAALVASLFVYVAVAHLVPLPAEPRVPVGVLAPVFAGIALVTGVGSLVYRRRALSAPIQARELDPSTPEGLQAALPRFVVGLALGESVGVYGLVLSLLAGEPGYALSFCGAALVLLYLHRPTAPDVKPPLSGSHP